MISKEKVKQFCKENWKGILLVGASGYVGYKFVTTRRNKLATGSKQLENLKEDCLIKFCGDLDKCNDFYDFVDEVKDQITIGQLMEKELPDLLQSTKLTKDTKLRDVYILTSKETK